jgi:hypothetical protein
MGSSRYAFGGLIDRRRIQCPKDFLNVGHQAPKKRPSGLRKNDMGNTNLWLLGQSRENRNHSGNLDMACCQKLIKGKYCKLLELGRHFHNRYHKK